MKLTDEELKLLKELHGSPTGREISGIKSRSGLDRLVKAGYVNNTAVSIDAVLYEITEAGIAALAEAEGYPQRRQ